MSEVSRWIWPFELLEKIGAGGMGVVYRARFVKNDKIVAVKLLPPDVTDKVVLARFQRELDVLKDLRHPHIVHCFGGLCEDKQQFYAMECIEGGTLDALIRKRGKLPWKLVVEYGLQMCSALACAHDRGVIHRDVKPGNFLITDEGPLKLSDFGLVSVLAARNLTATDRTLGTIRYMAPEQISGEALGPQTDLYALGCTLFEMLVGYAPFRGETPAATLRMHLAEEPARVSSLIEDCPDDLDALVAELLSKEPANRPESAEVVARRLREMTPMVSVKPHRREGGASNQPTVARSEPSPRAKPREPARGGGGWHSVALQGAIVVVAVLSIWVVSLQRSRTPQAAAEQLWKDAFRSDSDTAVRIRAAEALAQIGLEGGGHAARAGGRAQRRRSASSGGGDPGSR